MHGMIDLETLDIKPRSVVLSVGAVIFDEDYIANRFYQRLLVDPQFARQRTVSADILSFWARQDNTARMEAFDASLPRAPVADVAVGLRDFFYGCESVWAKGPEFDCVIWEDLCRDFGAVVPWRYNQLESVRTAEKTLKRSSPKAVLHEDSGMPAHHPLADCIWQAETVQAYWEMLDG